MLKKYSIYLYLPEFLKYFVHRHLYSNLTKVYPTPRLIETSHKKRKNENKKIKMKQKVFMLYSIEELLSVGAFFKKQKNTQMTLT